MRVRHVRSIFIPQDETCLHFYEADSADAVHRVIEQAELPAGRVVEAVDVSVDEASAGLGTEERSSE